MHTYRAYLIGADSLVIEAKSICCDDDAAAIRSAEQFVNGSDAELWLGDRKVAAFDARPK